MWKFLLLVVAVSVACAAVPALGQGKGTTHQISIVNGAFNPASITIKVGDTITWTNNDADHDHTVSGKAFSSGNLKHGASYSFTFTTAGTFDYSDGLHPRMKGKIVVQK